MEGSRVSLAGRAGSAIARAAQWGRRIAAGRPDAPPVIYLHIGRNKAGSTTLQDFFLAHRAELERGGVRYALFGHLKDSVPGIIGFGQSDELAAHARAHPDKAMLVSNEFMFGWPREYTDAMVAGLKGLDVRVIAYIRPYDSWLCSSYAQDVRNGESRRDFDAYFDWLRPRVSAWPYLEAWGEGLGWNKIRVRAIDPRGGASGDLVADCLTAMGLDPGLGRAIPPSNQAPHWATVELLRALIDRNREEGWDEAGLAIAMPLRRLFEECLAERPGFDRRVQYLTPAQEHELIELYNRDLARLSECIGPALEPQLIGEARERPFLPSLEQVPAEILRDFVCRARAADFVQAHPEAAASQVIAGI
jgi:hypothetical protein